MKASTLALIFMLLAFLAIAPRTASTESEYTDADRVTISVSQNDLVLTYQWHGCYQGQAEIPCD